MKLFHCLKLGSVGRIQLQKVTWDPSNGWTIWCVNYVSMKLLGEKVAWGSQQIPNWKFADSSVTMSPGISKWFQCHYEGGKNQDSDEHEHSWRNANSKYSWLARCFEVRKWGWRSPVPGRNSSWRCVRSPPAGAPTGCLHSDPQDCKTLTYKGDFWKGGNTQSSLGCRLGNAECSDAT